MPDPSMFDMFSLLNKSINKGFKSLLSHPFDANTTESKSAAGGSSGGVGGSVRVAGANAPAVSSTGSSENTPPPDGGSAPAVGANYNPLTDPYWDQRSEEFKNEYMGKIESGEYSEDLPLLLDSTSGLGAVGFKGLFSDDEYFNWAANAEGYSRIDWGAGLQDLSVESLGNTLHLIGNDNIMIQGSTNGTRSAIFIKQADGTWKKFKANSDANARAQLTEMFGFDITSALDPNAIREGRASNVAEWIKNLQASGTFEKMNKALVKDRDGNYVNPNAGGFQDKYYKDMILDANKGIGIRGLYDRTANDPALREKFMEALGGENYDKLIQGRVDEGASALEADLKSARSNAQTHPTGLYNSVLNLPTSKTVSSDDDDGDDGDMLSAFRNKW